MEIKDYKDLIVWRKSIDLVKEIYAISRKFPKSEDYGLTSQMRRSALSIPSNIAEGYGRRNRREYLQFLGIANGSAAELETQIIIAKEVYVTIDFTKAEQLLDEVKKMLYSLMTKLNPAP